MNNDTFSSHAEARSQESTNEETSMTLAKRAIKLYVSSKLNGGCGSPSQYSEISHQSTEFTEEAEDLTECSHSLPNSLFMRRSISKSTETGCSNEHSEFGADEATPEATFNDESTKIEEKMNVEQTEISQEPTEESSQSEEIKNWCEKKDKILKNLASKCKYDWKKIAKKFNTSEKTNYTPLVLKQKYKDLSRVSIPLRVKFTHEEDLLIARHFEIHGCDWTAIASHFTDRTAMMLKNRYYSFIRKRNLLPNMLEEVKDTKQESEPTIEALIQVKEESEYKPFSFYSQKQDNPGFRKFSFSDVNSTVFEIENSLSCQLYDRITEIL